MKTYLHRLLRRYRTSRYAPPLTFVLLFLGSASTLTFLLELRFNDQFRGILDGFWWAFVTFSTTGYGDKVPVTLGGRAVAVITIFVGILAMGFLSGTMASVFVERNARARRGLMEYRKIRDHFVICGWKDQMKEILLEILSLAEELDSDRIVLVSMVDPSRVEELREEPELKALKFVRGDFFSESVLMRANVREARKVLILADALESAAATEVDSRTVMAVLAIKSISRDIYVCAELLDRKYESYLKQAMCDEIFFSRDFTKRILARTTASSGMTHILYQLISAQDGGGTLKTVEIPQQFVNKPYADYRATFTQDGTSMLLGILENTGSPNWLKIEAIREAQKTSDVSRLVSNLQKVKTLEANRPVILPSSDYVIQQHSRAIVLERA